MVNWWKEGDKIRCIDMQGRSLTHEPFLHLNEVYTCKTITGKFGNSFRFIIRNKEGIERSGYFAWRFKKVLPELSNNITVL